jgi:hypothetical protein
MDGSLGALHTDAAHRRKGLARWVVQQHLKTGRGLLRNPDRGSLKNEQDGEVDVGGGGGAWTVVFRGNEASEGLWINLGWRVGWECAWVYKGD